MNWCYSYCLFRNNSFNWISWSIIMFNYSTWEDMVVIIWIISIFSNITISIVVSALFVTDNWYFNFNSSTWKIWIFYNYCYRSIYISSWSNFYFSSIWIYYYWNIFSVFVLSRNFCITVRIINNYACSLILVCRIYWVFTTCIN